MIIAPGPAPRGMALEAIPRPEPGAGELLVRVAAVGMNHSDLHVRSGRMPVADQRPIVAGSEVAGVVAAVGADVSAELLGARVFCDSNRACGRCRQCRTGHENVCGAATIAGVNAPGGLADYAIAPASTATVLPDAVSCTAAAAVGLSGLTAWHMLHSRAEVRPGETVLVASAGSAVGALAVQIARESGARVLATTSSQAKASRLRMLGAELVIDHRDGMVRSHVLRATDGQGADVVIEHTGGRAFATSLRCAARGGRVVTCGATAGADVALDLWKLFSKEVSVLGSVGGTRTELAQVIEEVAAGRVEPVIAATVPLEAAEEAYARLRDPARMGKVVVVVDPALA